MLYFVIKLLFQNSIFISPDTPSESLLRSLSSCQGMWAAGAAWALLPANTHREQRCIMESGAFFFFLCGLHFDFRDSFPAASHQIWFLNQGQGCWTLQGNLRRSVSDGATRSWRGVWNENGKLSIPSFPDNDYMGRWTCGYVRKRQREMLYAQLSIYNAAPQSP